MSTHVCLLVEYRLDKILCVSKSEIPSEQGCPFSFTTRLLVSSHRNEIAPMGPYTSHDEHSFIIIKTSSRRASFSEARLNQGWSNGTKCVIFDNILSSLTFEIGRNFYQGLGTVRARAVSTLMYVI